MRLNEYLRADLVLTGFQASDRDEVIDRLARLLAERRVVPDADEVRDSLLERERAHTTAMGEGVALPHATVTTLDSTVLAVAVAPEPIAFGPEGTDPVRLFFVLLSPPGGERVHIKLLARICRLVRHPGFTDALLEAGEPDAVLETIERVDEQHV